MPSKKKTKSKSKIKNTSKRAKRNVNRRRKVPTVAQMMPSVKERLADIQGAATGNGSSSIFSGAAARSIQNMGSSFGLAAMHRSHAALPIGDPSSPFMFPTASPTITAGANLSIQGSKKSGLNIKAADVSMIQPFFHTPGNAQDAYNLPKSYVEQIRWSRLMYNLNAYIGAITDLKAYYALSMFDLTTSEPFVTEFYKRNAFNRDFNLYRFLLRMSLSYHKFGEAIPWGNMDIDGVWPKTGKPRWVWKNFILLEPELVEMKKPLVGSGKTQFFLRPSRDLQELVDKLDAGDKEVADLAGKIGAPVLDKIRRKELVPIDPSTISAIQNLTDASAVRGTPPYQRLFVTFIYEDFIRLSQMAQAQRYHFPIELWTLGDLDKNILPSPADLQNLRDLVTQAIQTPPFAIFFPPILKYEALGVQGKLLTIKSDYEYIWQQYTVGMGVSENIILGEALALDTPIPTPTGWTTMGELKVGDKVFARDGSVTEVIAKSPVWSGRPTYSVWLSGADILVADENHKWVVGFTNANSEHKEGFVFNTKLFKNKLYAKNKKGRYWIPAAKPLDLPAVDLPIPPYTFGAWIGSGGYSDWTKESPVHIYGNDVIESIKADGFSVDKVRGKQAWVIRDFNTLLEKSGILKDKHIPDFYLRASYAQRLAFLQGLMDTNGFVGHKGICSFTSRNHDLVRAVRELMLTLGLTPEPVRFNFKKKDTATSTECTVTCTVGLGQPVPFRRPFKALKCSKRTPDPVQPHRDVVCISRVTSVPTVCIQVAHPSGTFLAGRDFIVTHNSGIFSSTETSSNQAFIRARKKERDELEEWMRWQFFYPLAERNNLKIKKGDDLVPILPDILWEKTLDYATEERELKAAESMWEKGIYPTKRLLAKHRENPDEIAQELKEEIGSVFDDGKRIAAPSIRDAKNNGEDGGSEGPGGIFEGPGQRGFRGLGPGGTPEEGGGIGGPGGAPGGPTGGVGAETAPEEAPATGRPEGGEGGAETEGGAESAPAPPGVL
jgi:hypothetical protein